MQNMHLQFGRKPNTVIAKLLIYAHYTAGSISLNVGAGSNNLNFNIFYKKYRIAGILAA